ncbi:MAG TPA: hypothetical protein DCG75_18940 [Bacteroidales bacterium]|nr:hypothetical protein [Bacteroidales bacterium]
MNLKELTNISLEDIYWLLKAGRSKKKVNVFDLRSNLNKYIKNPVFFLSTGRCGTKWFSDLLKHNKSLMILHSPVPNLAVQGKFAYEILNYNLPTDSEKNLLKEIYFAGREQYLRYTYKTEKRYVETNNYITFFAPILAELFPEAKFVHLFRHPGEFVRSGIRRNYYSTNNPDDIKRITPQNKHQNLNWETLSQLEKTAWLWNETNLFIENFKEKHSSRCQNFNFNELSVENVNSLLTFLDIDISKAAILKSLGKKSNTQIQGSFPKYEDWDQDQKIILKRTCSDLAKKYDYKI